MTFKSTYKFSNQTQTNLKRMEEKLIKKFREQCLDANSKKSLDDLWASMQSVISTQDELRKEQRKIYTDNSQVFPQDYVRDNDLIVRKTNSLERSPC